MKIILGLTMILLGIVLGVYVGFWICLIGGIVKVVSILQSPEGFKATEIAWPLLRILGSSLIGYVSAMILFLPGYLLLKSGLEE